jgi:hypothetical protein
MTLTNARHGVDAVNASPVSAGRLPLYQVGITWFPVHRLRRMPPCGCPGGASINAAAKASGINYRTAQRIVEAAAERRQGQLVAAS